MSQAAQRRTDSGTVREARRPFSAIFRRWLGGGDDTGDARERQSNTGPEPVEYPDEYWDPVSGPPPVERIRPMRPKEPMWKKDIPGLTDPFLDEDEWDAPYSERQPRDASYSDPRRNSANSERYEAHPTRNVENSSLPEERSQSHYAPLRKLEPQRRMDTQPERNENLDAVVDRLLRDKDFLLAEELKHKAEEINHLLVQAQRQKMKVELSVSELEARPGSKVAWLDVKIFKEI